MTPETTVAAEPLDVPDTDPTLQLPAPPRCPSPWRSLRWSLPAMFVWIAFWALHLYGGEIAAWASGR